MQIHSPNDGRLNWDARNQGDGARIHKWNRNYQDTSYLAYYENWYDGNSYHSIGIDGNRWKLSDGLDVSGTLTATTIDTGQGATEVHLMNQNLRTTDEPTFAQLNVASYIRHQDDTDTYLRFVGADDLQLVAGGRQMLRMDEGGNPDILQLGDSATYTRNEGHLIVGQTGISYTNTDNAPLVGSKTDNRVHINGSIQLTNNNDAIVFGRGTSSFMKDEEIGFGWGGGWYMTDGTYLRVRNNKILYSTGEFWASRFNDVNNTGYYGDFASTSNLNQLNVITLNVSGNTTLGNGNGDTTHINDIVHIGATDSGNSDLFFGEGSTNNIRYGVHWNWDSGYRFTWNTRNNGTDTTLFYYDTNSTSYVYWNRSFHMQNKEINYLSQLHFNDNIRFYDEGNDSYLNFKYGDSNAGGIKFYNGGGTRKGYLYADNTGFGLLDNDGNWAVLTQTGTNPLELRTNNNVEFQVYDSYTLSPGSSRAPIFYDSNNSGYYFDGASTTQMYRTDINNQLRLESGAPIYLYTSAGNQRG